MLENMKSTFFIRIIFSFLDEKVKLKIVKYNKNLQKKLDIEVINYFIFTKKYIVKEKDGFSKVYFYNPDYEDKYDDTLIFEGKYLNGLKNGKCKEYDPQDGYIKFEGEYLKGIKNGKCKEYKYGYLTFEGEYLNGKRNGKGKEYYDDEKKLKFDGEYLNGEKNGKGKEYYYDGTLNFEGEYLNGERLIGKGIDEKGNLYHVIKNKDGKGKEYYNNGVVKFEGEYLKGKRNGKGKEYTESGTLLFEGEYLNGERNGKGKEYGKNGELEFEGEYLILCCFCTKKECNKFSKKEVGEMIHQHIIYLIYYL